MPKLPSSLKWLIDRRGRVAGEIKKIEQQLAQCHRVIDTYKQLDNDVAVLRQLLESVDRTLALHEVQVELALIPIIRSQEATRLPRGLLTKSILEYFRTTGNHVVSSRELSDFVLRRLHSLGYSISHKDLARRLKYRLQTMRRNGCVIRHHDQRTQSHGLWSLVERQFSLDIQILDGAPGSTP